MFWAIPFCLACGLLNRARGSQLYGLTTSTTIGRLVATLGMAGLTYVAVALTRSLDTALYAFVSTWALLMLWAIPAWDAYWGAAIGHDQNHSRLWGLAAMTLRQLLILVPISALAAILGHWPHAIYLAGLLGLPYLISGYLLAHDGNYIIAAAEFTDGLIIGALLWAQF